MKKKKKQKNKYLEFNISIIMRYKQWNHKNQLLREEANKIYEIELKYKNKERELERKQKAERESYERIISSRGKKTIQEVCRSIFN